MKKDYYSIHKNKKPKKAKYSKPYTNKQLQKMRELTELFTKLSIELSASITHIGFGLNNLKINQN